jgi:recombinational DNA repair protein RecR
LAEQIKAGRSLSQKQLAIAKNKVKRYHRQLVAIANENDLAKSRALAVNASEVEEGRFKRLSSRCECENFDGERACDWCLDPENAEARMVMLETADIQRLEREEVERVAAYKMRRDDRLRAGDHW